MKEYRFDTKARETGRAAAKRLRHDGLVPVNVYGHGEPNRHVALESKAFEKFFSEGHRILTLSVGGADEHGVIKEIQYDHMGLGIIHVDIARISLRERIVMSVPVVTVGIAKGQVAGGTLDIALKELDIEGPANAIPESITIRVQDLEIDQAVRVRDVPVPPECKFSHDDDEVVLAVHAKVEQVEPAPGEVAAEPELIGREAGKEDEDGAAKDGKEKS